MISESSHVNDGLDGASRSANMTDGASALESQSSSPAANGASSASRSGVGRPQPALTKKLLSSISAQFRRSLSNMGSARVFSENGKRTRSVGRMSDDVLESKVMQVIERVRSRGHSEDLCQDLRNHFSRLPARYTLNIDGQRHEDVLLHMNLLKDAWKGEAPLRNSPSSGVSYALPQVHVRKVQLVSGPSWLDTGDSEEDSKGGPEKAIPIPRISQTTFGSGTNLAGLIVGSPKVHPSRPKKSQSSPSLPAPIKSEESSPETGPIPPPTFVPTINPLEVDEESDQEDTFGYEITLATSDRRGLLKFFTNVLSSTPLQLNIKEAHVFSTTHGMALEVFVVEGWTGGKPRDLKQAVLQVLGEQLNSHMNPKDNNSSEIQLRTAVEELAYEDWTIDFKNLEIGVRLGGGSSGRLYKGKYLSQDVAIKVIDLDSVGMENDTGSLRTVPAAELLQTFKQEVSIMRLVRHKNLIQFIGACSSWPKLCIVTELMSGGSVRDVVQAKGCGLEYPTAVKVLRDAARGMDFLHRRGIVHRDLKAANLLIDEHDVVKVCDFGVARLKPETPTHFGCVNWSAEMTAETGTYRWMAPEVLGHKPYDHKADVYSFGILMWEVLTGEVPYSGFTPLQAAIGVVQRGLRPTMPSNFPQQLVDLAESCWHQEPAERPEFSEVVTILEELVKPMQRKTPFWKKIGSF